MRRTTSALHWALVGVLLSALVGASVLPTANGLGLSLQTALGQVASGATLSVLAADVEVSTGGAFGPARDGMTVGPGDQIRTSNGGVALLTFFDGSETQLTPDSQVQIQQAAGSGTGAQISVSQVLGTTVQRVQRLTNQPTNYSTDTPAATAVVRGTRYALTTKCYAAPPPLPPQRLLTFPRRLSGEQFLLADEVIYSDNGTLWEDRAWQDAQSGQTFDTYAEVGSEYPEISDTVYQEADGSYWLDREWQDPESGATWHTFEDVGVPADDQTAASLPPVRISVNPIEVAQAQPACHPLTSVVVIEGVVGMLPKASSLTDFDVTPGNAGATSDVTTATSPLTTQAQQAFDQATSNLRDVNAARTAGQLGGQVADEFAAVVVPSLPPPGGPGGPGGPCGPGGAGGLGGPGQLLGGVVVRSATADSGLLALVVPLPLAPQVAGVQAQSTPQGPAGGGGATGGQPSQANAPPGGGAQTVAGAAAAPAPTSNRRTTSSGSSTNTNSNSAVIGSGGGQVGLSDGSAVVVFPPGAVTDPTTVQIARTGAPPVPAGQQLVSGAVALSAATASGAALTQFAQPVQLTLAFSGTPPAGIFFFDGSTWHELSNSSVNQANHTVTAPSSHFTVFGALTGSPDLAITGFSVAGFGAQAVRTATLTPTATVTPTATSVTPSVTPSVTATATVTPTATSVAPNSSTVTPTVTPTPSVTPSVTPTATTVTPSVTSTASVTPTVTPSLAAATSTSTSTSTPSPRPTPTDTSTPKPTSTPTRTPTPPTIGDDAQLSIASIDQLAQSGGAQVPATTSLTLQVTVKNQGTADTGGPFEVALFVDPPSPPTTQTVPQATAQASALAAGATEVVDLQLPNGLPAGNHTLVALANSTGVIAESDSANDTNNVSQLGVSAVNAVVPTNTATSTPTPTPTPTP